MSTELMLNFLSYCAIFPVLLLAGCTSTYHLGKSEPLPFESICVKIVGNESFVPQIQALITRKLGDGFARDSRLVLSGETDADAILNVVVLASDQKTSATSSSDTELASYLAISLRATCSLIDGKTGREYFTNEVVSVEMDLLSDGNYSSRRYQVMPKLCDELVNKIVNLVGHPWIDYASKDDSSVPICR
ncbi:MAG: LPS assembly lipoprotein LptE [Puniceicoccales bacterium]|jgi:hypothetical protein|nr:LPS assembly lipoprotein LptE [Puniceicoccales bacterium]